MSRRKRETPSSLELFLDTICNTFGGIVFLAILLAVLVQNRSRDSITPGPRTQSVSPEQAEQLAIRAEDLRNRLTQYGTLIEDLQQLQPSTNDHQLDAAITRAEQSKKELAQELESQKALASELDSQNSKNLEHSKLIAESARQAKEAEQKLQDDKAKLRRKIDEHVHILNLPRVELVSKRTLILFMRYGKVYRLFTVDTSADAEHLRIENQSDTSITVEPKRNSGWSISRNSDQLRLTQYLNSYSPLMYAIKIYAWSDSYEQFAELKQLMLQLNFQYELNPYYNGDTITFVSGSTAPMVQ